MTHPIPKLATHKQIEYILLLANDLGFDRKRRDAHITSIIGPIWGADFGRITLAEASLIITKFKEWKDNSNANTNS